MKKNISDLEKFEIEQREQSLKRRKRLRNGLMITDLIVVLLILLFIIFLTI